MTDKYEPRTPAYRNNKYKQTFAKPTPVSSVKSQRRLDCTPAKRSKQELPFKRLEDEETPENLFNTISTPTKSSLWKTIERIRSNKENIPSNSSSSGNGNNLQELSIIAHYDEIIRNYEDYFEDDITEEFLEFAEHQELCRLEWLKSVNECKRLQTELDKANHEIGDFSNKLKNARRLLDKERKFRQKVEEERNNLEQQMLLARDLLFSDKCNRLPDDTREKLAFLNNTSIKSHTSFDRNGAITGTRLNTISEVNSNEINTTGSLLSDFSYSRSEDGLDVSAVIKPDTWKRPQHFVPNNGNEDASASKKRRSSTHKIVEINSTDKIVATTTLSVSKEGPITATSTIEAVPQEVASPVSTPQTVYPTAPPSSDIIEQIWLNSNSQMKSKSVTSIRRQHNFISKAVIRPDTCASCSQRIRFGKLVLKCKDCRGICHIECKNELPLPCIPLMNTPTQKGVIGSIADYAPSLPPMVPALIVYCINEIELRGITELGIYRIPGSEKDVKILKEKFLRSKSVPNLSDVDIHVICGVVKDFLRSLREPLITNSLWKDFIQSTECRDPMDVAPTLYQAISQLPQPNRDTLAYLMIHLHKVAESKDCKMSTSNLAKVFGPTIVGYSSQDIVPEALITETRQQFSVMENLFAIPQCFWSTYVNIESNLTTPHSKTRLQTPSTDSSRSNIGGYFTPYGLKSVQNVRKKRKFFGTPPSKK